MAASCRHFNFFVIGGGSGGIAAARRAAQYEGVRVGVAERAALGGTCVNVGCVPKKIMWWAATVREMVAHEAKYYGVNVDGPVKFDWAYLKQRRDACVHRLNGIYASNLEKSNVDLIHGHASFLARDAASDRIRIAIKKGDAEGDSRKSSASTHALLDPTSRATGAAAAAADAATVEVITADHVLIAVGGRPDKLGVPGDEFVDTSDDFFRWEALPAKVAVVGAGYIAVELAGVLRGLGSDVHLFIRGDRPLRTFDEDLGYRLAAALEKQGVVIHRDWITASVAGPTAGGGSSGGLTLTSATGAAFSGFDKVLGAIGRSSEVEGLRLDLAGVKLCQPGRKSVVQVNQLQETSAKSVYALGDVCGKVELTPMAIAAGRLLADRLFGGRAGAAADYQSVPCVVFSHPPIGSVGITEKAAAEREGADNLAVFRGEAVNLYYNVFDVPPAEKPRIFVKLVCAKKENNKILGLHAIGMGADEFLQGFAVAIKMGATKHDFDRCVAIHPTAAEEVVTLPPWNAPP